MNPSLLLGLLLFFLLVGISWGYWFIRYGPPRGNPILLYHKIDRKMEWGGTWNTPSQFETQMKTLKEKGYTVVPLENLMVRAGFKPAPISSKSIAITFDDGYENVYQYAYPLLHLYGYPATIFLISGFVGKENLWDVNVGWRTYTHLNWDEIIEMKRKGITFGSHTVTHRDLTKISLRDVRWELLESKRRIEEKIGEEVKFLSYPFGRYNHAIQEIAKEVGYSAAFTSYPKSKNDAFDPYATGRVGIYIIDTLPEFRVKTFQKNLFFIGVEEIKGRVINFFSHGTPLVKTMKIKVEEETV